MHSNKNEYAKRLTKPQRNILKKKEITARINKDFFLNQKKMKKKKALDITHSFCKVWQKIYRPKSYDINKEFENSRKNDLQDNENTSLQKNIFHIIF